jgi:hypothetical protein
VAELVWYAAYGSNMSRRRFQHYLKGGRPEGAKRVLPGCSDPSDPIDDRPWVSAGQLVFAKHSTNWGGGVAFLDTDRAEARARFRLYLVTSDQFTEIWEQEGSEFYPLVPHLGDVEGHRVVTVTDRTDAYERPSDAYLGYVVEGLRESHGLTAEEASAYLADVPGICSELS